MLRTSPILRPKGRPQTQTIWGFSACRNAIRTQPADLLTGEQVKFSSPTTNVNISRASPMRPKSIVICNGNQCDMCSNCGIHNYISILAWCMVTSQKVRVNPILWLLTGFPLSREWQALTVNRHSRESGNPGVLPGFIEKIRCMYMQVDFMPVRTTTSI